MARLPQPGADAGSWGQILNDYLKQTHAEDGTLKANTVGAAQIKPLSVTNNAIVDGAITSAKLADTSVTDSKLSAGSGTAGQVLSHDGSGLVWSTISNTAISDATDTTKGIIQLAGDLSGNASAPVVEKIKGITLASGAPSAGHVLTATSATNASWQMLPSHDTVASTDITDATTVGRSLITAADAAAVRSSIGLGNVDNTSDTNKPLSTAIQTALGTKANDSAVVKLSTDQSIDGIKTFTSAPVVPDNAFSMSKIQDLETALSQNVQSVVLDTTGTQDIGPLLQAAYDGGISSFILKPGATYLLDSAVFLDKGLQYRQIALYGNGAVLRLGPNLPTTNWNKDTTTKWGIFPNTLRSALSGGVVTVNDANRATGSNGQLRGLAVYNLMVDGQGENNRAFVFANRATCLFHLVIGYRVRAVHTWFSYTDGNCYEYCYLRGVSGAADTAWFVDVSEQGDGIVITSPKSDAGLGFANLSKCRGAVITGNVTAGMKFTHCTGIVIEGGHLEGQQAGETLLELQNSQVRVVGGAIYENWSSTVHSISINDTDVETASELVLDGVATISLWQPSAAQSVFSSLIHIESVHPNTRIVWNDVKGMMTSTSMSGNWVDHRQSRITANDTALSTALATPRAMAAIASGSFTLRKNLSSWTLDTIAPQVFNSVRQESTPPITQILSSGNFSSGGLTNGQLYEYAYAVIDALGNFSTASTALSSTATSSGVLRLLIEQSFAPAVLVVWRKLGTGVLSAPDAYVVLPVRSARTYLYDTGVNIAGVPWVTTNVPIPAVHAAVNNTKTALYVNGIPMLPSTSEIAAGYIHDYDASTASASLGAVVTSWIDRLGGPSFTTATNGPTVRQDANSKFYLEFDGVNDTLLRSMPADPQTMFVVAKMRSGSGTRAFLSGSGEAAASNHSLLVSGSVFAATSGASLGSRTADANLHAFMVVWNGGSSIVSVDTLGEEAGSIGFNAPSNNLQLARGYSGGYYPVDVYRIVIYPGVLSPTQRAVTAAALKAQYSIT